MYNEVDWPNRSIDRGSCYCIFSLIKKTVSQHIPVGGDVPRSAETNVAMGSIDDVWIVSVEPYKSCLEPFPIFMTINVSTVVPIRITCTSFMTIKSSSYSFFHLTRYTAHKCTWYGTYLVGKESLKKGHRKESIYIYIYTTFSRYNILIYNNPGKKKVNNFLKSKNFYYLPGTW